MSDAPLRVAIVGAGPSGIYAADALTNQDDIPVSVDLLDRLPVPFGLVRYGVAPDHFSIRSVRDTLQKVLAKPAVRFLGNVEVGSDLSIDDLRSLYDAFILTYGAARDRRLGVPGEDLEGSIAATDLVNWYCGHPDAPREEVEAVVSTATSVVVVGVGNVAIDVVRILAKTPVELDATDMPQHVLDTLAASRITDIHLLGRRGPVQATFTTKELKELGELAGADVVVDPAAVELDAASAAAIEASKVAARNVEVLRGWAQRHPEGKARRIHVHFCARPVGIVAEGDRMTAVEVERTRLDENQAAHGTGETWRIPADAIVRSVGYRGEAFEGMPFDESRNVIPSDRGRVLDDGAVVTGAYVAGWIKRGPTGIIGTNKKDASDTVAALLEDVPHLPRDSSRMPEAVDRLLAERGVDAVTFDGWLAIDAAERYLGASRGRHRTTIHERADLLAIAQT